MRLYWIEPFVNFISGLASCLNYYSLLLNNGTPEWGGGDGGEGGGVGGGGGARDPLGSILRNQTHFRAVLYKEISLSGWLM